MAKKPVHELQSKLGSALDKIAHLPHVDAAPTIVETPAPAYKAKRAPVAAPLPRGKRTSVNLFDSDLELLDPLRDFLRKKTGVRVIRDSTLVQVLCRAYEPSETSVTAFREVTALDQRRKA